MAILSLINMPITFDLSKIDWMAIEVLVQLVGVILVVITVHQAKRSKTIIY